MIRHLITAAALVFTAQTATAQQFAEGSAAKEWGLLGEEKAIFQAKVVDLLCELAGDCTPDCGAGRRQLGLLRASDGVLVLPMKNRQANFAGAAADLAPFCGKDVEVDGVLIGDEDETKVKFYMVQLIREVGKDKWKKTSRFTRFWKKAHPEAAKPKGPWFRKDPRVNAAIAKDGYLGLGLEADEAFKKVYFE